MKKLFLLPFLIFSIVLFTGCDDNEDGKKEEVTISFEGKLTEANTEFTTTEGELINSWGYYRTSFKDPLDILEFSHYYGPYGLGGGFTYTNKTDITTCDFTNVSAITGKGKNGSTYLTATSSNPIVLTSLKADLYQFKGAWITNSTFAYLVMRDGNVNSPAMGDDDWFKLTVIGYDSNDKEIDSIDLYLGDYRNGKKEIVNEWIWVDFSPISEASYITFEVEGSVENEYGPSLPTYFCMDGITLEQK